MYKITLKEPSAQGRRLATFAKRLDADIAFSLLKRSHEYLEGATLTMHERRGDQWKRIAEMSLNMEGA